MNEIKFFIGTGVDRNGVPVEYEELWMARKVAAKLLREKYEGFTEYEHFGEWGETREPGVTYLVISDDTPENIFLVAEALADFFRQLCVYVTITPTNATLVVRHK